MIRRALNLSKLLGKLSSTFIFGPRGSGKTSLVGEYFEATKNSYVIDLLGLDTRRRYIVQPGQFRTDIESRIPGGRETLSVLVDEIQKMPELLDEVHYLIEKYKQQIQFVLSGSSARKLKRSGANLLAGRALSLRLHPLCSLELELDLERALSIGTLPSFYLNQANAVGFLKSYVETYIKEEILQESIVRQGEKFINFLEVAAQSNAQPLNFSKISRQCRVNDRTAKEYFEILSDTLLGWKVPAWSHSARRKSIEAPKFYFFDCGVLNTLRGELSTELRYGTYRYGVLFENFIVCELIRINDYLAADFKFHHWRTQAGHEVDLVISRGISDRPRAIEIKSMAAPQASDLRDLILFKADNPDSICFCLCTSATSYNVEGITVLPWREGLRTVLMS